MAQVSIIIPVYNVSQYLDKCISSVINQTFKNIEIIVVNDGSTDDSAEILERYAKTDTRIKIITKENEGLSMARATGIGQSTSPYIYHLDGDDYIEIDLIESVYAEMIRTKADILMFRFQSEYLDKSEKSQPYPKKEYSNLEMMRYLWRGNGYFAVWAYMHKKELYKDIQFYKGLSYGEDAYLTSQLVFNARKIVFFDSKPLHHYLIRSSSLSNGQFSASNVRDLLLFPVLIEAFIKTKSEYLDLYVDLLHLKVSGYMILIQKGWLSGADERAKETIVWINQYPELLAIPSVRSFKKLNKLFARSNFLGQMLARYYRFKGKIA